MDERDVLAERFDAERGRLRAVAYRMPGSLAEAEGAVQEPRLRLARSDEADHSLRKTGERSTSDDMIARGTARGGNDPR